MHPVVTWSKHTVFAIATQLGALWLYLPSFFELAVRAEEKNVLFSFSVKSLRYDELINWIIACYRKIHSIGHSCPQGNSLGLLYALGIKFALFSQVFST